jgi:hypothetical protein
MSFVMTSDAFVNCSSRREDCLHRRREAYRRQRDVETPEQHRARVGGNIVGYGEVHYGKSEEHM